MSGYRESAIRNIVRINLQSQQTRNFLYQERSLNYSGKTSDTQKLYTEVIADELIKNYSQVAQIGNNASIRRTKSFNANHNGVSNVAARLRKYGELKYGEELLGIALYNSKTTYCLGDIFDYEVPLKEKQIDKYGEIDLVSTDNRSKSVKLIELKIKGKGSGETFLRTILEIYTYYKLITSSNSQTKFLRDFRLSPENYSHFQPAVLVDKIALSGETILNIHEHPHLQELISAINQEIGENIEAFVYDYPNRGKPFEMKDQSAYQKIRLRGDIAIKQIDLI